MKSNKILWPAAFIIWFFTSEFSQSTFFEDFVRVFFSPISKDYTYLRVKLNKFLILFILLRHFLLKGRRDLSPVLPFFSTKMHVSAFYILRIVFSKKELIFMTFFYTSVKNKQDKFTCNEKKYCKPAKINDKYGPLVGSTGMDVQMLFLRKHQFLADWK